MLPHITKDLVFLSFFQEYLLTHFCSFTSCQTFDFFPELLPPALLCHLEVVSIWLLLPDSGLNFSALCLVRLSQLWPMAGFDLTLIKHLCDPSSTASGPWTPSSGILSTCTLTRMRSRPGPLVWSSSVWPLWPSESTPLSLSGAELAPYVSSTSQFLSASWKLDD